MKKVLVLGASLNVNRYSNMAIKKLHLKAYDVIGIGSMAGYVEGITIFTEQKEISNIHTITVYLNPFNQRFFYKYILELNPKRVIFNPGAENKELEHLLDENNIQYEKACTLVMLSLNKF